jgi:hypothetical protein
VKPSPGFSVHKHVKSKQTDFFEDDERSVQDIILAYATDSINIAHNVCSF